MNKFLRDVCPEGLSESRNKRSAIEPTSIPVVTPNRVTSCQKLVRANRDRMTTRPPAMAAWYGIDFEPK